MTTSQNLGTNILRNVLLLLAAALLAVAVIETARFKRMEQASNERLERALRGFTVTVRNDLDEVVVVTTVSDVRDRRLVIAPRTRGELRNVPLYSEGKVFSLKSGHTWHTGTVDMPWDVVLN